MKIIQALAAVSVCFPISALAQTERDLDSHVHGAAALNVVLADSQVFVELQTPWNNLVGFEHSPQTDEQHALVDDAIIKLNSPDQLFSFEGGNCQSDDVQIASAMSLDDHGEEHGEEHSEEHGDEHSDENAEDTHSSILVTYSYQCADIGALSAIDLKLFSVWSGFTDLDVQIAGPSKQAFVELSPQNTTLSISQVQ